MRYPVVTVPQHITVSYVKACQWAREDGLCVLKSATGSVIRTYIAQNSWCYWLAANSWLCLVQDLTDIAVADMCEGLLRTLGWRPAITWLASYADCYIRDNCTAGDHVKSLISDFSQRGFWFATKDLAPQVVLQICRYLKRFTVKVASKHYVYHDEAIEKFNTEQRRLRDDVIPRLERLEEGDCPHEVRMVLGIARYLIRQILDVERKEQDDSLPYVGKGAARNCARSTYAKMEYLFKLDCYKPTHIPRGVLQLSDHPDREVKLRQGVKRRLHTNLDRPEYGGLGSVPQVCCLGSVPKKIDSARLIAKEDPVNMHFQLSLKTEVELLILRHRWGVMMPLKDQSRNQEFARLAALTGKWATVDFSAASDSISKKLAQLLLPSYWYLRLLRCVPTGYIVSEHDAGPRRLNSAATMGCGCTFVMMTLIVWAIAAASWVYTHMHTLGLAKAICLLDLGRISVYGDDVILPVSAIPVFYRVSAYFGFRVNEEKSFADGDFRESCGADWLAHTESSGRRKVVSMTSVYWPRIPMGGTVQSYMESIHHDWRDGDDRLITGLEGLLSLQHRLFLISPRAAEVIARFIRNYAPDMTCSYYAGGVDPPDLAAETSCGIRAVYVGGQVDRRYRVWHGAALPDGYVLWTSLEQFITDHGAQDLNRLAFRIRYGHYSVSIRPGRPVEDINIPMLRSILYDFALSKREHKGDPMVILTDGPTRSLYECIGGRPDPVTGEGLAGKPTFSSAYIIR